MKESLLKWRMLQRFSIIEGAWGYPRLGFFWRRIGSEDTAHDDMSDDITT